MKHNIFLILFSALCIASLQAADTQPNQISFKINEKQYRFSNYFELNSNETSHGVVVKKRFAYLHLTNHYEAYDNKGKSESVGIARMLSLGAFYSWGTEIDIYDPEGIKIGMIDGQALTLTSARFSLYEYDEQGNWTLKGIAYMDDEKRSFSIIDPENDNHILVSLKRIMLANERDHWECHIYDTNAIDPRIVKIFAAFAVDHQEYFRPDT